MLCRNIKVPLPKSIASAWLLCCAIVLMTTSYGRATDIRISVEANACPPTDICFRTSSNVLPLADYSQTTTNSVVVSASVTADTIKLFADTHNDGFVYVSFNDTYTLTGPAALMGTQTTVIPTFEVTGTMSEGSFGNGLFYGVGGMHVKVGSFQPDPPPGGTLLEQFRVAPFGTATTSDIFAGLPNQVSSTPIDVPVDLKAFAPITVTYGVPFDVAYEIQTGGAIHTIFDFSHTGKINFDIPDGAQLTSTGGYSQGGPTTPTVPEPASLVLLGSGLLATAVFKRRHR